MQRFFFPSIGLSQAGRLGGEIQMIKYTKIAIFLEVCAIRFQKMFWAYYANIGKLSAGRLVSCWLLGEGVLWRRMG